MRSLRTLPLIAVAIVLACGGCGNSDAGDAAEGRESFIQVLRGLERAASDNETYRAVARARNLDGPRRKVVEEFCNQVFQIRANGAVREAHHNRPYVVERLVRYATYLREEEPFAKRATAAVRELELVIDLGALDAEKLKHYLKACYE